MATEQKSTDLATTNIEPGGELLAASQSAAAIQEIQAAVVLAKKFPRDYDKAWANLMKACERKTMAEAASYAYPRGNTTVNGPSVNLARVAAQCYGNIRFGLDILRDDQEVMLIEGWGWDMENNIRVAAQDRFKKLIYRKKGGWQVPDERDLRELVNRRGAILVRNCLLQVLPRDLIEDAEAQARETLKSNIKDPNSEKKRLILEFDKLGVTVEMMTARIGYSEWTADDIVDITQILKSLQDKQAQRSDFFDTGDGGPQKSKIDPSEFKNGDPSTHQNHREAAASANGDGGQSESGPSTGKTEEDELRGSLGSVIDTLQNLLDSEAILLSQRQTVAKWIANVQSILSVMTAHGMRTAIGSGQAWIEWIAEHPVEKPPDDLPGPPTDNENDLPSPPESSPESPEESSPEATTNGDKDPGGQAATEREVRTGRLDELLKLNRAALVAKANTTLAKVDMADESFDSQKFLIKACQTGILAHHVFGNKKNTEEHLAVFIMECEELLKSTGDAKGVPPRSKKARI